MLASEPERGLWHRAASVTGPDERVARELEQAAAQARQRGATAMAVAALQRAAALSDAPLRGGRLLLAEPMAGNAPAGLPEPPASDFEAPASDFEAAVPPSRVGGS